MKFISCENLRELPNFMKGGKILHAWLTGSVYSTVDSVENVTILL